jgi:hypothetical protein
VRCSVVVLHQLELNRRAMNDSRMIALPLSCRMRVLPIIRAPSRLKHGGTGSARIQESKTRSVAAAASPWEPWRGWLLLG